MMKPESALEKWYVLMPTMAIAGVAWWVCGSLTTPVLEHEKQERDAIAVLHDQIEAAARATREIETLSTKSHALGAQIDRLEKDLPGPSLLGSFPDRLEKHFAFSGLDVSSMRMNKVEEVTGLPDYRRAYWSVTILLADSNRKVDSALEAIEKFERQHPFAKVLDLAVQPDPGDPSRQAAAISLTTLFRQ